ncbi:putative bifunctional diguanylate cyclase/phosphodiesterase [Pseudoxanthomonas jiangsuensis]|uniref:putative bifunctional diguanylate cyclase/phosphodiesterase n=1 Tax=Pseudoxanthomonas jiangsuensis TaxID=619688 RepID=UPI001B86E4BA|nr:EAL domain-containing protein [Pseudoxanthomonas jiangsuensis]
MPPKGPIARMRAFMSVSADDPALLKAQYQAFSGQIPLMYAMLLVNTWLLASTHIGIAPRWLVTGVPLLFTPVCALRCIQWWRGRHQAMDAAGALRALRRTNRLVWPLAAGFAAWSLALYPYGDAYTRSHVAFYMAVTIIGVLLCLMHVRPAMLAAAAVVNLAFVAFFATTGVPTFTAMTVNVALVTTTLVGMLLRQYDGFTELVRARLQAEALGGENLRLANLDSLTGLPNRRAFFAELEAACARARERGSRFAVGILDLDGFKPVNDLYGHAVGDRLLEQVGVRLSALVGGRAHLARLGGDEFALIIEDIADDASCAAFARHLCTELRAPFPLQDNSLQVAASMGLVVYPDLATNASDLYEHADYALYQGKRHQRGGVSLFSTRHQHRIQQDAAIEQALRKADLEAELSVVFQPIVDTASRRTLAFEALARWHSPAMGTVSPAEFIPVAERTGLITQLTRVLLAKALDAAATWPEAVGLSFNLSIHDLGSEEEVARLVRLVLDSGVHPARIDLEITETAVMQDMEQAQWAAGQLRGLGCGVTLDDFGTGFSSLSRLLALPLTRIKIDRRFVSGIQHSPASLKIVRSLLALSRDMELGCVIEGVEGEEELAILRELGGSLMQGYLFARPMPAADVPAWLAHGEGAAFCFC